MVTGGGAGAGRLVLVSDYHLPTLKAEGEQNVRIAESFSRRGWETVVVHPAQPGPESLPGQDPAAYYRVRQPLVFRPVDVRHPLRHPRLPGRLRYVAAGWRMAVRAREQAPRLAYTRDPMTAWWLTRHGVPTVFEAMTMPAGFSLRVVRGMVGRPALRLVGCITRHMVAHLGAELGGGREKLVLLPIGVEAAGDGPAVARDQARRALGLPLEGAAAVYTGGMREDRGIEVVLHAARHLPGVEFYLMGGRPAETERMRALAAELGLRNARIVDHVPPDRARLYQAAADVLLMPQAPSNPHLTWYTSPAKLFEYMAVERPVVAADVPCFRELVRDGENALLAGGTGEAWAAAVRRLLDDAGLAARMAATARDEVPSYTWDRRAERIHQVLNGSNR